MIKNEKELAQLIDHTLLKPYASQEDLRKHCEVAMEYGFKTVAINNAVVPFCTLVLEKSSVICDAAISFPLGQCTIETKVFETTDIINKGAGEVDYVVNLGEVKNGNWAYIKKEMEDIVAVCHARNVLCKVIFENCYLSDAEKEKLCEIALIVKPDFIKTSTGFGTGGATLEDVKLMKRCVGNNIQIKAAGGIRDYKTAQAFLDEGVTRIGTSAGVDILEGFRQTQN
jgi:deoxyribose-phosphate aldolase